MSRLVTLLGAASLVSTTAFAGNAHNSSLFGPAISQSSCYQEQCVIFRVALEIDIDAMVTITGGSPSDATRIVVNDVAYVDEDGTEMLFKTKVVQQGNHCEKRYIISKPFYKTMVSVFDSIIDEDGNVVPQMNKTQQAFMGFFLSLIDDKAQFQCSAIDLGL